MGFNNFYLYLLRYIFVYILIKYMIVEFQVVGLLDPVLRLVEL